MDAGVAALVVFVKYTISYHGPDLVSIGSGSRSIPERVRKLR